MKSILALFFALTIIVLSGCLSQLDGAGKMNSRQETSVQKNSDEVICANPPAEYTVVSSNASAKANLDEIIKEAEASYSSERKIQHLRKGLEGTFNFEVVEYRLCLAVSQGNITSTQYAEMIKEVLPKLSQVSDKFKVVLVVQTSDGKKVSRAAVRLEQDHNFTSTTDSGGTVIFFLPKEYKNKEVTFLVTYSGYGSASSTRRAVKVDAGVNQLQIVLPGLTH